jgi:hypothetical protein
VHACLTLAGKENRRRSGFASMGEKQGRSNVLVLEKRSRDGAVALHRKGGAGCGGGALAPMRRTRWRQCPRVDGEE